VGALAVATGLMNGGGNLSDTGKAITVTQGALRIAGALVSQVGTTYGKRNQRLTWLVLGSAMSGAGGGEAGAGSALKTYALEVYAKKNSGEGGLDQERLNRGLVAQAVGEFAGSAMSLLGKRYQDEKGARTAGMSLKDYRALGALQPERKAEALTAGSFLKELGNTLMMPFRAVMGLGMAVGGVRGGQRPTSSVELRRRENTSSAGGVNLEAGDRPAGNVDENRTEEVSSSRSSRETRGREARSKDVPLMNRKVAESRAKVAEEQVAALYQALAYTESNQTKQWETHKAKVEFLTAARASLDEELNRAGVLGVVTDALPMGGTIHAVMSGDASWKRVVVSMMMDVAKDRLGTGTGGRGMLEALGEVLKGFEQEVSREGRDLAREREALVELKGHFATAVNAAMVMRLALEGEWNGETAARWTTAERTVATFGVVVESSVIRAQIVNRLDGLTGRLWGVLSEGSEMLKLCGRMGAFLNEVDELKRAALGGTADAEDRKSVV
jgi:hypothetical protein